NASHGRFSAEISFGLARAYLQQGRSNEAETELAKSIALDERALTNVSEVGSRSGFIESRLNIYRTMVDFQYFHKRSPAQAFDYAERYRGRELLDVLTASDASMRAVNGARRVAQPLTLEQVRYSVPAQVQLLAYTATEQQLLIWQITSTEWHVAGVPVTPVRLQALVSDFLNKLRNLDDIQTITPLARDLHRLLIEPMADHL